MIRTAVAEQAGRDRPKSYRRLIVLWLTVKGRPMSTKDSPASRRATPSALVRASANAL
jgi:hypothetical protein